MYHYISFKDLTFLPFYLFQLFFNFHPFVNYPFSPSSTIYNSIHLISQNQKKGEIAQIEAQLLALKASQQTSQLNDANPVEVPALTPRGGGANAIRALRKETSTAVTNETTTTDAEISEDLMTAEQTAQYDQLDRQLYADNSFFPTYVPLEGDSADASTDKADEIIAEGIVGPDGWVAKKTRGKFGKVYWVNATTGRDHYFEAPPSSELLAQWAEEAAQVIRDAEAEEKRKRDALEADTAKVEREWKARLAKERGDAARFAQEEKDAMVAAQQKIPAWKQRLLDRKAKKAAEGKFVMVSAKPDEEETTDGKTTNEAIKEVPQVVVMKKETVMKTVKTAKTEVNVSEEEMSKENVSDPTSILDSAAKSPVLLKKEVTEPLSKPAAASVLTASQ